jgi:Zn ribbon nucleic-acid-binding protein
MKLEEGPGYHCPKCRMAYTSEHRKDLVLNKEACLNCGYAIFLPPTRRKEKP